MLADGGREGGKKEREKGVSGTRDYVGRFNVCSRREDLVGGGYGLFSKE